MLRYDCSPTHRHRSANFETKNLLVIDPQREQIAMTAVRATVRLQFHREFPLDAAIPLVSYFNQLGISHLYTSPILKARAGSLHGYDMVDPSCINPELGGEAALGRLVSELRKYQMGLIVDVVCNHMAVGGHDNPWWLDVLQWGIKSPHARYFDIQWNSPDPLLRGQLLVPFLRGSYGDVLARGEVGLHFNRDEGQFYVQHFDHWFPLYPPSYAHILRNTENSVLFTLVRPFEALEYDQHYWHSAKKLHRQLSEAAMDENVAQAIARAIGFYDVTRNDPLDQRADHSRRDPHQYDPQTRRTAATDQLHADWHTNQNLQRLHELLELQHFRLASWSTAADDINWRRFFDVNELGGLCVERPEVFEATHTKIFELIEKGWIDGLRIDHVDGLANPRSYCRKLRRRINSLTLKRPPELAQDQIPIYVEKILGHDEQLGKEWNVNGTTGYDFMNQISLLQHDPRGELQLFDLWSTISGRIGTFKNEMKEARRLVLSGNLAGDLEMVARNLLQVARTDITTRDLTLGAIRRALIELIVNFPIYRTYATAAGRSARDQEIFNQVMEDTRLTLHESDWPILDYLNLWLGGQPLCQLPPGERRQLWQNALTRFQQLTSPAAAKAVEDTAFYRSAMLLSRNDVGFDPEHFSSPLAKFHQQNGERAKCFPDSLLTTATHDHKRGEDTRARLAVISERSPWFAEKIQKWMALANVLRANLDDGIAPSPADEIILYQTLLGSWPPGLTMVDKEAMEAYLRRLLRWQEKALREAKLRSSWNAPNNTYEAACRDFLIRLFAGEEARPLLTEIGAAAASLAPAGVLNSLSQSLLRMTAPGIPDLYQGTEFWDFSLVDPDNRQPVDFVARVASLPPITTTQPLTRELIERWQDGRVKQWLIAQTLSLRKAHRELFQQGDYQPLNIAGEYADLVVAFIRHYRSNYMLVIAPRLAAPLLGDRTKPHIPSHIWGDTHLLLPAELNEAIFNSSFNNSLTTTQLQATDGRLLLGEILADFPVNILIHHPLS
jgi:(1->4)-alpha-D-glucan 1-alpha-D-glucosylmutase